MAPQQLRVGLENSKAIICESCGNNTFTEANYLRSISKLLTGSSEDMIVPIPTFTCTKCGHVNKQFKLKNVPEEDEHTSKLIISSGSPDDRETLHKGVNK